MTDTSGPAASIERVPTGVPGLDAILRDGLLRGAVYLVMGHPGAGKTILTNQIAFLHTRAGGRAAYITLLAESHSRMLAHLEGMDFYDPKQISTSVFYLSGYQALESQRLDGLLELVRSEVRHRQASLLVLDGVITAGAAAESELALKKFIHELKAYTEMTGCICLITTSATEGTSGHYPAKTMVDGLIELRLSRFGMRTAREIEIVKHRGSHQVMGGHLFDITRSGIVVYPRIEAIYGHSLPSETRRERLKLGVEGLDEMLGGGFLSGSVTIVLGPPGSGKTLLGLQFLHEGLARSESGVYFGFFETPQRLVSKAETVGMTLAPHLGERLVMEWVPPLEQYADAVLDKLLALVRERKAKRLVLDGIGGIAQSMLRRERLDFMITALTNELRRLDVTTLITEESGPTSDDRLDFPLGRLSAAVDNILVLRYLERERALHRSAWILKIREGDYDAALREFSITARGFQLLAGRGARRSPPRPARKRTPARPASARKKLRRR